MNFKHASGDLKSLVKSNLIMKSRLTRKRFRCIKIFAINVYLQHCFYWQDYPMFTAKTMFSAIYDGTAHIAQQKNLSHYDNDIVGEIQSDTELRGHDKLAVIDTNFLLHMTMSH